MSTSYFKFLKGTSMVGVRGFGFDDETGEVVFYQIDEETGEPMREAHHSPASAILNTAESPHSPASAESTNKKYTKFPKGITTKTKKFLTLKEKIMSGSNEVSHRMLLIPTVLMIFPGFLCVCITLLEMFLHFRCHRKNKHLTDPALYYRSPFHAVTSTFCGICRLSDTTDRIGQLQDQRRYRYDYLRGIAL